MKKITLFLMILLVSVLGLSAVVAGASASTVLFEDFYRGEYADFKNGEEEIAGKDVVIFFGSAPIMEENVEYGVALQKDGSNQITYYKANKFNENDQNKFGIAISVGGDPTAKDTGLQAGTYTVKAYERSTSDTFYADCSYSAEQTITISLDEIPAPTNVYFDKANGIVGWDAVNGAEKYIVKLYAGDTTIYEDQITETTINFSEKLRALDGATLDALQDKELAISVQSFTQNNKLAEPVIARSELFFKVLDDVSDIKAMNSNTYYGVFKNDIIVSASDFTDTVTNVANDYGSTTYAIKNQFVSSIDGLGRKLIVKDYTSSGSYALFGYLNDRVSISNLFIDTDIRINYAFNARRIGILAYTSHAGSSVTNCYIKAKVDALDGMPVSGSSQRLHLMGRSNSTVFVNCVFDIDAKANGADISGAKCTPAGQSNNATFTNCSYVANDATATMLTSSNYVDMDAFITAFKAEEVANQSTYTAWSVRNDQLFLYDTQLTFETVAGPTGLAISGNSATWTAIDGVEEYNVQILGDETVYAGTVSGTKFDISNALASVSGTDLDKLNSKKLTVKVSANVQNANCEYTSATSTYTVKVISQASDITAMMGVENMYGVLKQDVQVEPADFTVTFTTNNDYGGTYYFAFGDMKSTSTIDGLGRKISVSDYTSAYSYGLFNVMRGTLTNLVIDTNVSTNYNNNGRRICLIGYDVQATAKITNCYFTGTADIQTTASLPSTNRVHLGSANGATYTNCIFNVEVTKNGVPATGEYLRLHPANGAWGKPTVTNSAYIDSERTAAFSTVTSVTNTNIYASIDTFISAFKANEVANQSTYTAWSVDANDKLCLVGTQIA